MVAHFANSSGRSGEAVMMLSRIATAIGSLGIACALCASDAHAQQGFYFGPEGGWTGLQGTKTSITGTNPITNQTATFPINQSFNSGWNVGARAGYQWGPWRVEGEYSHRQNGGNVTGPFGRLKGTFDTNSFMANGLYDFSLGWPITPHIGFGIGAVEANGTINAPNLGSFSKSSDTLFAYQAIAGFRYMYTPSLAFDLDYRYRGSSDATWRTQTFTVNGATFPGKTYKGTANTNNVVASLTWLFAAPPPIPVAAPLPPPPPALARQVFIVFFDWDKATITPEGMGVVHQAADAWRAGGMVTIHVTGYTDASGSVGYNQRLSERRANNVAGALAQSGVPRQAMDVSGRGKNDLRVPTADGVREPQNRRVEIVWP